MLKNLVDFEINAKGKIIKVNGDGKIRRRLLDMGVTPGAIIILKKKAPLGDPIEISIRGYDLSLRKDEANLLDVEVL